MPKLIQVIIDNDNLTVGSGNGPESPIRRLTNIYDTEGILIVSHDPKGGFAMEDMLSFANYCFSKPAPADFLNLFYSWKSGK